MNTNLPLIMPTIDGWLKVATSQLSKIGIASSRLDAEILLSFSMQKERTYLHAHCEKKLVRKTLFTANTRLKRRLNREPMAYIIGYKEFYGRLFSVTPHTLIPRPESESIIDILSDILKTKPFKTEQKINLIDIGTGTGCLGITAKLEYPKLNVTLSDISKCAIRIAKKNAKNLSANVDIIQSDLLKNYLMSPRIIIANLPYVNKNWKRSAETNFEPSKALFAKDGGTSEIKKLIDESSKKIHSGGYLIIEADLSQHDTLVAYAKKLLFLHVGTLDYAIALKLKTNTSKTRK